jgi:hypothetical protein
VERPPIQEPVGFVAGVWANDFDVYWSPHEMTLDFFRVEIRGHEGPRRAAAVARVAMTPALLVQLRKAIDQALEDYQAWTSHADLH